MGRYAESEGINSKFYPKDFKDIRTLFEYLDNFKTLNKQGLIATQLSVLETLVVK